LGKGKGKRKGSGGREKCHKFNRLVRKNMKVQRMLGKRQGLREQGGGTMKTKQDEPAEERLEVRST